MESMDEASFASAGLELKAWELEEPLSSEEPLMSHRFDHRPLGTIYS